MLKLDNIHKTYRTATMATVALNAVNIDVAEGEFIAIMGPSGCGKSTLLNIMGLLDTPDSGEYRFMNNELSHHSEKQLGQLRKQHIGFIFQQFNLLDELSVEDNIELALLYHDIGRGERKQRVLAAMDRMGIAHRAQHLPSQLSGGQQQRVAIARAVVADQTLILADEPTGNLDSNQGQEVMEMLQQLNQAGTTIVMVTHSSAHADYAKRTINLFDGQVITQSLRAVS